MKIHLAIEASQRFGTIAVQAQGDEVRVSAIESASGIDDQLMLQIDHMVRDLGGVPADLGLIGVSIGPGGFTGLRVATATAKALAMTTGCDLVGVPSAVVAEQSTSGQERSIVRSAGNGVAHAGVRWWGRDR